MDLEKSQLYISQHRRETMETMCKFVSTDLLLFWSDNDDVYAKQQEMWRPLLDLAGQQVGAEAKFTRGLQVPDNELFVLRIRDKLQTLSDKELCGCFLTATKLKSVILGLLMLDKQIEVEKIFTAAIVEELCQNEQWGTDEVTLQKRDEVKKELCEIKEFLQK